jgi:UDP-3-O-[3-hydroxymyristoyl] glucosamine N-acyltransferase
MMSLTAGELAKHLEVPLEGDPLALISGMASPERARTTDLIYVESSRHLRRALASAAHCVVAKPDLSLGAKTVFTTNQPKLLFAKAAAWLLAKESFSPTVHPTAVVSPGATLGSRVFIGPYVVMEEGAQVGAGSVIEAFCFLGRGSRIGKDSRLHPRVTVYAGVRIGDRVEVHSGAVIGSDGFGYVFGEGRQWKFPQIGEIEIGDDVEIGANTALDRGALGVTRVGAGTKIDNLVQVAHNVEIGEHCVIAAQTGISGGSCLGNNVMIAGQAGLAEHCTIGDGAIVGGQAGVLPGKTIRPGEMVWGTPARAFEKFKQQYAWLSKLPEFGERVRKLEDQNPTRE